MQRMLLDWTFLEKRRFLTKGVLIVAALASCGPAFAHTMGQRIGGYSDNQGLERQRIGYDMSFQQKTPQLKIPLSSQTVNITLLRDQYAQTQAVKDEYAKRFYQSGYRINHSAILTGGQAWDRSMETRQLASVSSDGVVSSRTFGLGASQWLWGETIRIGVDLSRTTVERPDYRVLDFDSQEIGEPPLLSSGGATFKVRHLATPTSIVDYTLQGIWAENRPPASAFGVAGRQFVPPIHGAVHGSATRVITRGTLSTDTSYGQVDAWIFDASYLQSIGAKSHARMGYRFYREDETTRVYQEEYTVGTDRLIVAFVQNIPQGSLQNVSVPLVLEGAVSRYLTNTQLAASSFELGLSGQF